ncbi:MFS transporter [Streptomyces kanamyceticus]|uniref:MFS transporter n=1 Tax=Streptomyces kanamyceticus TaxID=1967 RepID=A0A5J6GFW9_STRKN|nr:MFS transporter [Streptomyces kanamyceticus]QEU94820.1 MFS transporter [Streptomyces kanamyceticus]
MGSSDRLPGAEFAQSPYCSRELLRLRRALFAFSALNDLIPFVPVAALRFTDAGLDALEVSSLFGLLAISALLLEVPSGAWADVAPRRLLLALGALLRAACFTLWMFLPSYPAFVVGVLLWGACHALTSGTLEALVYDELADKDATATFPALLGRARIGALAANVLATLSATPLLALGHYALVEGASALVCLAAAGAALCLPGPSRARAERGGGGHVGTGHTGTGHAGTGHVGTGYVAMLRTGLAELRTSRAVRRAAVVAAVLPAVLVIDEYLPLLVRSTGVATATVPLLVVLAVAGKACGSWLAGPLAGTRPATLALALGAATALLAAGALSGTPWGIGSVALCLGIVQFGIVLSQARLQDTIECAARATVTSVASLGTDAVAILFYVAYGVGSLWAGVSTVIATFAAVPLLLAVLVPRWLPRAGSRSIAPVPGTTGSQQAEWPRRRTDA